MSQPYEGDSAEPKVPGLAGKNTVGGNGVFGDSAQGDAVVGFAHAQGKAGVLGLSPAGNAVAGISDNGTGVFGTGKAFGGVFTSTAGEAVHADSQAGNAVHGDSAQNDAVVGFAHAQGKAGVLGLAPDGNALVGISDRGTGIFAKGSVNAAFFEGNVAVTGDIKLINADCAEDFNIGVDLSVEPGTVMVLGEEGALFPSLHAYDKRVAGVISGAGDYKPGIVLDKQESSSNRQPVALLGKVFCKVDAQYGAIEVGDLLTTSPTPGHAMKTVDPLKAFGAVIGKALQPLSGGRGLIPVLVTLQ